MRRLLFLLAAVCVVAAAPVVAKPPKDTRQLTIDATSRVVVFGNAVTLTGRLTGSPSAGQEVRLQADEVPLDGFKQVLMATTDATGAYTFTVTPTLNTNYRVTVKGKPPATSPALLVKVRMKASLRVSDSTPERGEIVRFRGSVKPPHDGLVVDIQKRRRDGSYKTVSHARLRDAGDVRSRYSRRVRIHSGGVYRVRAPADSDHATGVSPRRRITAHD
jgi:hypothetical protein